MQHLDEGTIHSWLDGALTADEAARVEAHVKECPQCAAAVAEARGFIAASSRILTSLDNVPKGVVPIAQRPKVTNWPVWRAAAAVLVVALGSFVVLRDRLARPGRGSSVETIASGRARTIRTSAPPVAGATTQTVAPAVPRNATPIRVPERPQESAAERGPRATDLGRNHGNVLQSVSPATAAPQPETQTTAATQFRKAAQAPVNSRQDIRDNVATPAAVGAAGAAARGRSVFSAQASGAAAMNDANEPQLVRVVGRPRVIGQIQTLYEVAPGDTVLLAESNASLESIVLTGISATAVRQDTSLSGQTVREQAKASVSQDNARKTGSTPSAPAVAPAAPSVQTSNGITTLSWSDPATGSTVKLSGRHTLVELLQIKRRIEQFRAAEAAKKKP